MSRCTPVTLIIFEMLSFILLLKGQEDTFDNHYVMFTRSGRVEITAQTLHLVDKTKPSVFIIHGFFADISIDVLLLNITRAYRDLDDRNVLYVDWGRSSFGNYAGLVYDGVPRIGALLGAFLLELESVGVDLKRVHLIGHSLGAHIAGFAGRHVKDNHPEGRSVYRITGLDAAGPLYWKILAVFANPFSLRASDADIVDCTHSNGGYLGTIDNIGSVDFLINGGTYQRFCEQPNSPIRIISEHICNHAFSSIFYHLTIDSGEYLATTSPFSCENLIVYGDQFDGNASGVYYLLTEDVYPFRSIC